ncbi:MAG: site-specific DNA-methyltransferase, partial [bacterium]
MKSDIFFEKSWSKLVSLKEASVWASQYLKRKVTTSNIYYLIQYGKIRNYGQEGDPRVDLRELKDYYDAFSLEKQWEKKLGEDINWHLAFTQYKEAERTKHVHRLHPYKGKFIPQ